MATGAFPFLTVQRSPEKLETFELRSPRITIGSDPGCDIVDTTGTLAPRHAELLSGGSDFLISDCGAPEGCFVNGAILENSRPLRHEDVIQLGEMILVYHLPVSGGGVIAGASRFDAGAFRQLAGKLEQNIGKVSSPKATETFRSAGNARLNPTKSARIGYSGSPRSTSTASRIIRGRP